MGYYNDMNVTVMCFYCLQWTRFNYYMYNIVFYVY